MALFSGFATDRSELVPLPVRFFSDLLPGISRAAELKVTLHVFWLLSRQKGFPKCLSLGELSADSDLAHSLSAVNPRKPVADSLREALDLAVDRGTMLRLKTENGSAPEEWYFINTSLNKRMLAKWKRERADLAAILPPGRVSEARVREERTSIFKLYEENIGLLTPLIAEQLAEAEHSYPSEWIEDAFGEAVGYNRRNWRYISRILENWASHGRQGAKSRRDPARPLDPNKYRKGKYSYLVRGE